jgi:hypothetical protein
MLAGPGLAMDERFEARYALAEIDLVRGQRPPPVPRAFPSRRTRASRATCSWHARLRAPRRSRRLSPDVREMSRRVRRRRGQACRRRW